MFNFYYITKEDINEYNSNLLEIPDHFYRVLTVEGSGYGKTNVLFYLTSHQPDIDEIYLYVKDLYEAKHQLLINKAKIQT